MRIATPVCALVRNDTDERRETGVRASGGIATRGERATKPALLSPYGAGRSFPLCHPEERSDEGSHAVRPCAGGEILRFAQDDTTLLCLPSKPLLPERLCPLEGIARRPPVILKTSYVSFSQRLYYNDHRKAKSIEYPIDFAAKRQVWQRMII